MIKPLVNLVRGRPVMAVFEINLRCNSRCGYCDLPLNEGRYEMSRDEIHHVFTGLYATGLRYVFVQGGEPTLRKDLPDVLDDLAEIGFGLCLVTNGTRLTDELIARLAATGVSISVSLDTLDRDNYKRIRGADQLLRVQAGIERLANYPHPKFLTCIVSEQNRRDALDVARFARAKGFAPIFGAYHWDKGRYGKADDDLKYANEDAIAVFEELLATDLIPPGYYRRYAEDNIRWLSGETLGRCDAGRHSIAIDATGNVAGCLGHDAAGNLLEADLGAILADMDHAALRACSDASTCNLVCGRAVGSALRHPQDLVRTPRTVAPAA
ncbi:MAG: MoaA/NifB/PqqE/SkfB family radical SAM enzyme [Paracoccaceae bacterium]|jgi:MoaA/NifB/PqqE/SkfB family radical SAM enzyme